MTSRTPIRLTPHRGPLATPSTSPESSPTSSTPPSDISYSSTDTIPGLDIVILQQRISTLDPHLRHQFQHRTHRQGYKVTGQGPFGHGSHLFRLFLAFKSLFYSALGLAKTLSGIVMFCLVIWALLEWSSYASQVRRPPNPWAPVPLLPLSPLTKELSCRENSSVCEPTAQHVAVLQFLAEQTRHAKALSSLSISLGLPLRTLFNVHQTSVSRFAIPEDSRQSRLVGDVDTLANLTEFLDPSRALLDFSSSGFIGRSLALAMDELGNLMSEPISHGPTRGNTHLYAIYWRTTSNLLLEYSAVRPRARRLLQQLHLVHQQLWPLASNSHTPGGIKKAPSIWKWNVVQPVVYTQDDVWALVSGLEIMLDNVRRLVAYLDWITEQLAQTTLEDVLNVEYKTNFSSCITSLRELFAQVTPSKSRRLCFCVDDFGMTLPTQPERVDIIVPGSPTLRAGR